MGVLPFAALRFGRSIPSRTAGILRDQLAFARDRGIPTRSGLPAMIEGGRAGQWTGPGPGRLPVNVDLLPQSRVGSGSPVEELLALDLPPGVFTDAYLQDRGMLEQPYLWDPLELGQGFAGMAHRSWESPDQAALWQVLHPQPRLRGL